MKFWIGLLPAIRFLLVLNYGDHGVGEWNDGGVRLIGLSNWEKNETEEYLFSEKINHFVTYTSGYTETVVDYILANCCYRNRVKNVKVIPGDKVVSQHHFLVMDFLLKKEVNHIESLKA